MESGKLSESVLKRSVLRKLNQNTKKTADLFYGTDCAGSREGILYAAAGSMPGWEERPEMLLLSAANNLYAAGAYPVSVQLQVFLPQAYEEKQLQKDMEALAKKAEEMEIAILGGHTQVTQNVLKPVYALTAQGKKMAGCEAGDSSGKEVQRRLQPGDELVLTKWIALGGTAALAEKYEQELKQRYPLWMIDRAREMKQFMSVEEEARAVSHFGPAMHDLSQGGVFGALWEMADYAGTGLEVDLKKIPVRQETIEICEYFDVNPYELYSAGSMLIGTERGESLVQELAEKGIRAAVIGRVTSDKARVIRNGEECRYLGRPAQDAWYRLEAGKKPE